MVVRAKGFGRTSRLTRFCFCFAFWVSFVCFLPPLLPRYVLHGRHGTGRLATELNLSRIPEPFADERQERESHNRTRMWLMCFIMDRCLSIQSGKAWMVQEDGVRTCHALSAPRFAARD